jgi:hypothetical protein
MESVTEAATNISASSEKQITDFEAIDFLVKELESAAKKTSKSAQISFDKITDIQNQSSDLKIATASLSQKFKI